MDKKLLKSIATAAGVATAITSVLITAYAVKKRKPISRAVKDDLSSLVENIKDTTANTLHNKVGYPVYKFIKNKENIPF